MRKYVKPCMTNIPGKLGRDIMHTIRSTAPPDPVVMQSRTEAAMKRIKAQMEKERATRQDVQTSSGE